MSYNGAHWQSPVKNPQDPDDKSTSQYNLGKFESALVCSTETSNGGSNWDICANVVYWIETASHPVTQPNMNDRAVVRLFYPANSNLPDVAQLISGDPDNNPGRWDNIINWALGQGVTDFQILNEIDLEYQQYGLGTLADYMAGLGARFQQYYGSRGARAGFPGPSMGKCLTTDLWRSFWDAYGTQWSKTMKEVAQEHYDWVAVHVYPQFADVNGGADWLGSLRGWTNTICNAIYYNEVPSKDQRITEYGIEKSDSGLSGSNLSNKYGTYVKYVKDNFSFVRSTHVFILAESPYFSEGHQQRWYELSDQECTCMAQNCTR